MLYDAPCFGRVTVLCWLVRIWRCREPACLAGTFSEAHDLAPPRMVLTTRAVAWATSALSYDDTTVSSFQPDWEISPRTFGQWQSGSSPRRLPSSGGTLNALAISGDGSSITGGGSRNCVVWNLSSGKITARLGLAADADQVTHVV